MQDKRKTAAVFTDDRMLYQKIRLELDEICDTVLCESEENRDEYDLCFIDLDSHTDVKTGYTMSRDPMVKCDISLPFPLGSLYNALIKERSATLTLNAEKRTVSLEGKSARLTEIEFALFSALFSNQGDYVSREDLLDTVWGNNTDPGVLNVYIHYLREKLEKDGRKIILASRNKGYKIDEKYIAGENL